MNRWQLLAPAPGGAPRAGLRRWPGAPAVARPLLTLANCAPADAPDSVLSAIVGDDRPPDPRATRRDVVSSTGTSIAQVRVAPYPGTARPVRTANATNPAACRRVSSTAPRVAGDAACENPAAPGRVSAANPADSERVSAPFVARTPPVTPSDRRRRRQTRSETPPQTPSRTPPDSGALNAPAGSNAVNPGTQENPPNPPARGEPTDSISLVEHHITDRGRRRQRTRTVNLAEIRSQLSPPAAPDLRDWQTIRAQLARTVKTSMFEIWLDPLELIAVDRTGTLLLSCDEQLRSWIAGRWGQALDVAAADADRHVRLATPAELHAMTDSAAAPATAGHRSHR
jgi:hypothetical protein